MQLKLKAMLAKRFLLRIVLAFVLLAASQCAFAVTVSLKNICASAPVPTGWVTVNKTWNPSACGYFAAPQGNVLALDEFNNLPVGTPLTVCESSPIPAGWIPTSYQWNPAVCGAQYGAKSGPYNTVTIRYVLCTNETSALCYPSLSDFAVISALPTTVTIPYGQSMGSSVVAWFAATPVCIWIDFGGANNTHLWSCDGNYAIQTWPDVAVGATQTFIVSPSSTSASPVLASLVIKGVEGAPPKISASPTAVTVPAGKTVGSTTVSYNLAGSDYQSMCIWVSTNSGPAALWACGSGLTLSQVWPYVPKGGTSVFWLNQSRTSASQILASVLVTGK
jgi:hypothetical protein